jgi:hypothetical protein
VLEGVAIYSHVHRQPHCLLTNSATSKERPQFITKF